MALLVGFMYRLLHIEIIRLLKKKRLDPHFSVPEINELEIYKLDPSELPGLSEIKSDEQVWSFFCEPDYKYANSKRANRKTGSGYWKITGKALKVRNKTGEMIGSKKNLVYYKRVASKMVKTDWIMHEFYVEDSSRYKKDFVFCYVEKNPNSKSNISTPDDDQHQPSQSLASDAETYATEKASIEVESQQPSTHRLRNNTLEEVESRLLSSHSLVSDDQRNLFAPITSSMVQPQQLSNHNLEFDPSYHFVPDTSLMLPPHQSLDSLMVGPQLLSNQSTSFDPINHSASITSSMVEPQLLSNQNLVSDYSRNNFVPNTPSMVHPQVAELFAQFTALFGSYLLNHISDWAPQPPNNPEHGPYSFPYSNGAFGNNFTLSSSQFHGEPEDAWTAQRNLQDKYPCEANGQTLSAYTDTDNTMVNELFVDIPLDPI